MLKRLRDAQNDEAWSTFQEVYVPLIIRFCRAHGLQDADANDVSQDVLRAVSQSIDGFTYDRERGTFRSWLYQVTRSKLATHFRRRARQASGSGRTDVHELHDGHPRSDEASWDREADRRLFEWACEQVEPHVDAKTWQAFWRTAVRNISAKLVADDLGLSIGAVYVARSRITARLRKRIDEVSEYDADSC